MEQFIERTLLNDFKDVIKGSIVCIGGVERMVRTFAVAGSINATQWTVDKNYNESLLALPNANNSHPYWIPVVFRSQLSDEKVVFRKVVFLGFRKSFWGDMSGLLAKALCYLEAHTILHAAVKVGVLDEKVWVRQTLIVPSEFRVYDSHCRPLGSNFADNVLLCPARVRTEFVTGGHASDPSVLDETGSRLLAMKRDMPSIRSVDCEGAVMASAVKLNGRGMVRFGAVYFASNTLPPFGVVVDDDALGQLTQKSDEDSLAEEGIIDKITGIIQLYADNIEAKQ